MNPKTATLYSLILCMIFGAMVVTYLLYPNEKSGGGTKITRQFSKKSRKVMDDATLSKFEQGTVTVRGKTIDVWIAETDEQRQLGLSQTSNLPKGTGMLFIFNEPGRYGFWMKDMNYSIDMLWLDDNLNVVYESRSVDPGSYPNVYTSNTEALMVLETNPGEIPEGGR